MEAIVFMALALAAGGLVKGATGMGLPLAASPVLLPVFGLQHTVALMVIPLIVTNIWQVWNLRHMRRAPGLEFLAPYLVAGGVGTVIGTVALTTLPERLLVVTLGLGLLAYVCLRLAAPQLVLGPRLARLLAVPAGTGAGALQGATGIASPIGVTFIHSMRLEPEKHLFAVSSMFLMLAVVQLPALWVAGVMQPVWMLQGALALIPIFLFMPLGQSLARRLSRKAFDRMILIFLALVGLKMVSGL